MLTYDQAVAQILSKVALLDPADTPLREARGLVLAEDVIAPQDIPPFANSSMDGYAVRGEDVGTASASAHVWLPVVGEVAAGAANSAALAPGTAVRIMTGAPLPAGADTVVPIEDTETSTAPASPSVIVKEAVRAGQYVRPAGEDVTAETVIVTADTPIRPAEVGMFAAIGRQTVRVYPRPRVAIISTGDELIEPGLPLGPGQIYNSNAFALAAQVEDAGGVVIQRRHARDTAEDLRAAFDACAGADVILTSGGVSVGDYDFVKSVFAERGTIDFWRVAIRPGKPLAFGHWGDTVFFGLPGNPVSAMVTFELFVRPALLKRRGVSELMRPLVQARLTEEVTHEPGRRSYQRAVLWREGEDCYARPTGRQGSGMLRSMVLANALLIIPDDVARIAVGDYATVMVLETGA